MIYDRTLVFITIHKINSESLRGLQICIRMEQSTINEIPVREQQFQPRDPQPLTLQVEFH